MHALLLIDLQNDFLPGGALAVKEGDAVIPVANRIMNSFDLVVATQDFHPADHGSFASQHPGVAVGDTFDLHGLPQVAWPDHCVQGTAGAQLSAELRRDAISHVVPKGTDPTVDSYSGFFDNGHKKATGLHALLQSKGVTELSIMGLATDYCVKFTVFDAIELGYLVRVVLQGCRGVDLQPGDVQQAIADMKRAGAELLPDALI
ncbi:UNVERIFIED_CONTAM: hypothetical protein GTU68_054683 [Idotea baltica]|nr:hypothetical protein [Idotea baltica]